MKAKYRIWVRNLKNGESAAVSLVLNVGDPTAGSGTTNIYASNAEIADWTAKESAEYALTANARQRIHVEIANQGTGLFPNARCYIGAVEFLVYEPGMTLPTAPVLGHNSTGAWLRGVSLLTADPTTYEVAVVDLTRANANRWPYDQLLLGGSVMVTDVEGGTATSLRIVGLVKDHLNPIASRVTFTQIESRLSGLVAAS